MVQMRLHQDVEGKKAGETADVPPERADFYEQEGYAVKVRGADKVDGVYRTSVPASKDPRLAENADDPNEGLHDQLASGLGKPGTLEDTDDVRPTLAHPEDYHSPELLNVSGNLAKAEAGKEKAEDKAVEQDPEKAPEEAGETPAVAEKKADSGEQAAEKADADEKVTPPEA